MARTVDIALLTGLVKDLRGTETFAPAQVELRNVRLSDANNLLKRPGYSEWKDTAVDYPVIGLIDENNGYAITENGSIYTLGATVASIHTSAPWSNKPTWTVYDQKIIVAYGGHPLLIDGSVVRNLSGNPPLGKFVETISSYTILAGYDETEFRWSDPNNAESWPTDHTANIQKTGTVLNMVEYKDRLLFFKEREVEIWNFVGGSDPFVRYAGGKIPQGLGAKDSVVKANDRVYWFSEGDFYVYEDGVAKPISGGMTRRLNEMNNVNELIGFDFRKDNCIMWTNKVDGVTFLYDYSKGQWLEDGYWDAGWQEMPIASYMELNRKQYIGSNDNDGLVHEWSYDYKDDNGQPLRVFRRLKVRLSQRGYRVRIEKLQLRREGGVATATVTAPVVSVRWRFDEGAWSNERQLTLGATGKYDPYVEVTGGLGMGREFELEIEATDAVEFVMTNATITFTELGR